MALQKGDFIEISYSGKLDDGTLFDTTNEEEAKQAGIFSPEMRYGSLVICLGEGHILKALDEELVGKEPGQSFEVVLPPEKGFGKKDPKLIQLIATAKFTKHKIKPYPGLRVNVDGMEGTIKTVSGGRTVVDFNHPLAGRTLHYKLTIHRKIEDEQEKIKGYLELILNKSVPFTYENNTLTFDQPFTKEFLDFIQKELSRLLGKDITVKTKEAKKQEKSSSAEPNPKDLNNEKAQEKN